MHDDSLPDSADTAFRVTEQQLAIPTARSAAARITCSTRVASSARTRDPSAPRKARRPDLGQMAVLLGTEKDRSFDFGPPESRPASRLWLLGTLLLVIALAAQGAYRFTGEKCRCSFRRQSLCWSACAPARLRCPLAAPRELLSIEIRSAGGRESPQ